MFGWGDFLIDFTLSFYTYDPGCPKFTKWNGASCISDYETYCSSLTPLFAKQTGDPTTVVSFNGTACVVNNADTL